MINFDVLGLPKYLETEFRTAEAKRLLTRENHLIRFENYMVQFKPTTIEVTTDTVKNIYYMNRLIEKYRVLKNSNILEHFVYDKHGKIESHGFIKDDKSIGEWRMYNTAQYKISKHIYFGVNGQIDLKDKDERELHRLQSKWPGPWIGDHV
jgi:hypothetical protein